MAGNLVASFVRVRGQRDRIYVHRSDGSEVSWVFPTYGEGLPHDLVHLVVEAAFGLRTGFWGRVDAGVDPARVNDEARLRGARAARSKGGAEKYLGFGADRAELMLAEGLAAAPWFDPEVSEAAVVETCARLGARAPGSLTPERVHDVRSVLLALRTRWRRIETKGTLRLEFFADDPSRGFDAMRAAPVDEPS